MGLNPHFIIAILCSSKQTSDIRPARFKTELKAFELIAVAAV